MADRARLDAFMAETFEFAPVCAQTVGEVPRLRYETDIDRAVRTAERRLDIIAYPADPRMVLVLMHIEEAEFAADTALAEEKVRAVEQAIYSKGINDSQPPDSVYRTHKTDCLFVTRFQFLGWGILRGSRLVVMEKHMTKEDDDSRVLGRETQVLALNVAQGLKPLEKKVPDNTVGEFRKYLKYLPKS